MKSSIIIVDDDSSHRLLIKRAISSVASMNLIEFDSLKSADTSPLLTSNETSLILLDLNLAGESGLDLLELVRKSHNATELPVVLVSTSALSRDFFAAYAAGANAYIVKSSDAAQFRAEIGSAVRFFLR